MKPLGLSANRHHQSAGYRGKHWRDRQRPRAITADIALRFARYLGMSPQFWINLQAKYHLDVAQDAIGKRIAERSSRTAAPGGRTGGRVRTGNCEKAAFPSRSS